MLAVVERVPVVYGSRHLRKEEKPCHDLFHIYYVFSLHFDLSPKEPAATSSSKKYIHTVWPHIRKVFQITGNWMPFTHIITSVSNSNRCITVEIEQFFGFCDAIKTIQ